MQARGNSPNSVGNPTEAAAPGLTPGFRIRLPARTDLSERLALRIPRNITTRSRFAGAAGVILTFGGPQLRAEVDGPLAEQFGGSLELVEESGAQDAVFALCIPVVCEDSADGTTRAARRRPSDRRTVGP